MFSSHLTLVKGLELFNLNSARCFCFYCLSNPNPAYFGSQVFSPQPWPVWDCTWNWNRPTRAISVICVTRNSTTTLCLLSTRGHTSMRSRSRVQAAVKASAACPAWRRTSWRSTKKSKINCYSIVIVTIITTLNITWSKLRNSSSSSLIREVLEMVLTSRRILIGALFNPLFIQQVCLMVDCIADGFIWWFNNWLLNGLCF